VNHTDVERVIDAARAVAIPADQKILHILPQEFIIDGQEVSRKRSDVGRPARGAGTYGHGGSQRRPEHCKMRQDGAIGSRRCYPSATASSYAVLTEDEKRSRRVSV